MGVRTATVSVLSLLALGFASSAFGGGNPDVAALQVGLRARGLYAGTVDGVLGAGTEQAVRRFQRRAGLAADGVPGFDRYAVVLGASPQVDLFVDHRLTSRATARSEPSAMATSARCRAIRCSLASMTASREHPPRRLR